jgi:hypothetical protein
MDLAQGQPPLKVLLNPRLFGATTFSIMTSCLAPRQGDTSLVHLMPLPSVIIMLSIAFPYCYAKCIREESC